MSFVLPHKEYERPESGMHFGVLADIVDLGMVTTTFNNQTRTVPMVRFVWVLATLGKDGKNLQVSQRFNASSDHEKSNIYKTIKQILNAPPAKGFDIETLIGQTRLLLINREKSPDGTKDFANVMGILPPRNQNGEEVRMQIPADFIRAKFRPQTQSGPQGPVQTFQVPPQTVSQVAQVSQVPPSTTQSVPQQGSDVKF